MADVVAAERIFEDLRIPRTKNRTRRVLRYTPGQVIPEAVAKALGVDKKGKQKKVPTSDDASGVVPLANKVAGR